jgi:threonine/homoserine/homoserine lactone efflux protein
MVDAPTLLLFLPAMLAITLAPGADTLFVVAVSLRSGARSGVLATAGTISGGIVHIGFATIGLSALIARSAEAFAVLKYLGAAYLIYLGVRTLLERGAPDSVERPPVPARVVFARGFVTNVLNPKVAMFVLAFLPQFVSASRGPIWSQLLELGALWYACGFVYLCAVACAVGRAGRSGALSRSVTARLKYASAAIFIALGIRVALPEAR